MADFSALFEPLQLGPLKLKNRVVMSALTRSRAVPNLVPNDLNAEYYAQRAKGGAGLIVAEGSLVQPLGTQWPYAPGLYNAEQVKGWKKVVDAVHAEGTPIFAQLWHVGRAARPDHPLDPNLSVIGPSAIKARGGLPFRHIPNSEDGYAVPTPIEDPSLVVEQFKQNAQNAKDAGFDGVEIHGAMGYLIHQFLDTNSNKRTDKWGGSIENRARFAIEVTKACVEVFGPGRVAIKLSPAGGLNDVGMPLEETIATFKYLIEQLDGLDLAYFCLVRYGPNFDAIIDGVGRATQHDIFATYRPFIKNTLVMGNCSLTPAEASGFLTTSPPTIHLACFGIPWIINPEFANKLQKSETVDGFEKVNWEKLYCLDHGATVEDMRLGYTDYGVPIPVVA